MTEFTIFLKMNDHITLQHL